MWPNSESAGNATPARSAALFLVVFLQKKQLLGLLTINVLSHWGCLDKWLAQSFGSQGTDPPLSKINSCRGDMFFLETNLKHMILSSAFSLWGERDHLKQQQAELLTCWTDVVMAATFWLQISVRGPRKPGSCREPFPSSGTTWSCVRGPLMGMGTQDVTNGRTPMANPARWHIGASLREQIRSVLITRRKISPFILFLLLYLYKKMEISWTCWWSFHRRWKQAITLCALNLHSDVCQSFLDKTEQK